MCLPMRFNKLFVILLKWDVPCGRLQASGLGSDDIIQWLSLVFLEGQYVAWGPAGGGALRCSAICLLLHVTLNQKSLSSVSVMLSCLWQIIFLSLLFFLSLTDYFFQIISGKVQWLVNFMLFFWSIGKEVLFVIQRSGVGRGGDPSLPVKPPGDHPVQRRELKLLTSII